MRRKKNNKNETTVLKIYTFLVQEVYTIHDTDKTLDV
jgi:hypothetical protein